ncbi:MAG: uracil-DNA glycosylase [Mycobacterium sp.]|nr:uracil-DNA glycosylase [Mycobacterium sp.]
MGIINGRNADPLVVDEKKQRIRDPHVKSLNDLADRIADSEGLPHGHVPYADPDQGGVMARMLVLLDNPSTKAEAGTGSGLLSLDNNDRTARNIREAYARHGVDHGDVVHWNVVPFPVAGVKNGGSTPAERERAARWTRGVAELLPDLEIVLLLGAAARDGWKRAAISRPEIYVMPGNIPNCSMRGLNTGDGRAVFEKAIETAAGLLGGAGPIAAAPMPAHAAPEYPHA